MDAPSYNITLPGMAQQPDAALQYSVDAPTPTGNAPQPRPRISSEIGPDPAHAGTQIQMEPVPYLEAPEGIRFDFANSFRIAFPPRESPLTYRVIIRDEASGMLLYTGDIHSGQTITGSHKYYIRYLLEVYRNDTLIFSHTLDLTGRKVHVIIPDGGLGDNLAWLPIVERFRQASRADVTCVCGEWLIRLCGDLYPGLKFVPYVKDVILPQAYANYYIGIFDAEHRDWYPLEHQQLGMQGTIAAELGLPTDEHPKCRLHTGSIRPFPEPFVCISTIGTNPCKRWNFEGGWNTVVRFLKSCGYRVLDIDRDRQIFQGGKLYTTPSEAEDFTGYFPLQERINLLEHADFFIGLPSGLSWLAWELDKPVVMISGFTMPGSEFPTPYRVFNPLACHGCWNDSTCFFDQKVQVWCPRHAGTPREIECTRVISPKMVLETIARVPEFQRHLAALAIQRFQESSNE